MIVVDGHGEAPGETLLGTVRAVVPLAAPAPLTVLGPFAPVWRVNGAKNQVHLPRVVTNVTTLTPYMSLRSRSRPRT